MSSPASTTVTLTDGGVLVFSKVVYVSPIVLEDFLYQFTITAESSTTVTAQYKNDEAGKSAAELDRQNIIDCL